MCMIIAGALAAIVAVLVSGFGDVYSGVSNREIYVLLGCGAVQDPIGLDCIVLYCVWTG